VRWLRLSRTCKPLRCGQKRALHVPRVPPTWQGVRDLSYAQEQPRILCIRQPWFPSLDNWLERPLRNPLDLRHHEVWPRQLEGDRWVVLEECQDARGVRDSLLFRTHAAEWKDQLSNCAHTKSRSGSGWLRSREGCRPQTRQVKACQCGQENRWLRQDEGRVQRERKGRVRDWVLIGSPDGQLHGVATKP